MGIGGATVALWNTSTGALNNPLAAIQSLYKPDLCLIQDMGKDWGAGTAIATYKTNLTAIITACEATGDVLLVSSQPGEAGVGGQPTYDVQQTYAVAAQQVATSTNVP